MKKITLLALLLSGMAAGAQEFQWVRTPGSTVNFNPDMVGYSSAADASGNIYFTGFAGEPYAYNDMMGNLYFNKYDSNGGLVFSTVIGGKACNHNMVTDSQGNVILSLGYVGNITMDGTTLSTTDQGDQFVLAKFSPQGTLLWHKPITTAEEFTWTSEMNGLTVDSNDNIYIGYGNFMDSFIDKYSPDGAKLLSVANENVSRITSVSIDSEGNIYAAGSCAEFNAFFNGVSVPTDMQYNTFVVKYSPQGAYQWVRFVEDITCPTPQVVARTPNEVYFSSYLFGSFEFGTTTTEGPLDGMFDDFFLAKLDASGNYQWVREVLGNGSAAQGNRNFLALDTDGNVYFTGFTTGTINWGNGITTVSSPTNRDAIVLKYNPEGTVMLAKTAGGTGYDNAAGISLDTSGNIYLTGMVNGPAAFDELEITGDGQFNYIPYLAKLSNTTLGGRDIRANGISLYPNPASGQVFLEGINGTARGAIFNAIGQQVMAFETDGTSPITIDQLASGMYVLKVSEGAAMRFVKR